MQFISSAKHILRPFRRNRVIRRFDKGKFSSWIAIKCGGNILVKKSKHFFSLMHFKFQVIATQRIPAFSLIEMGFVLMIMGCMLTVSLPFFSQQLHLEREKKARDTFEQVSMSLGLFLLHHKRLPCPANPSSIGEDFGREDFTLCGKGGIIPYKTLNLSPSLIKDGGQRYLTYMPNPSFTDVLTFDKNDGGIEEDAFAGIKKSKFYFELEDTTPFKILDERGHLVNEDAMHNPVFVLISHGMQGGDLTTSGQRRPLTQPSAFKTENSNDDFTFIDAPKTTSFDDMIFWKDRFIFARHYAGIVMKE